jgi:4-coumarate--CoA ligase
LAIKRATFEKDDLAHMMAITKPRLIFCDASRVAVAKEAITEVQIKTEIITFEEKLQGIRFVEELLSEAVEDEEFYV